MQTIETTLLKNEQPFILTIDESNSSVKSFPDTQSIYQHVRQLAEKDHLFPKTGDFESLSTLEDLLNREAPVSASGKAKVFSIYRDLEDYIADMCTFDGIKQTVVELRRLNDWGFDLHNFFNADEVQEFSEEAEATASDVAFLKRVCKV